MRIAVAHLLIALQAPAPAAEPAAAQPPQIEFTTAPFDLPAALRDSIRFGWLTVPQDHDDPAAGTIRLALTIIPARTARPAPDPLVLLPGGPGGGHVATGTLDIARSHRIDLHRRSRAVIVLDPRGHGLSEPRTCPELKEAEPLTEEDTAGMARLVDALAACRSRLAADGVRPELLNAVQAARDLDVLRRAVDAPQLNLVGASYGSRLAGEAMRQIPWAVRSVVMNGPVVPLPRGAILPGEEDAGVFRSVLRRCAEQPECRAAFPRVEADYDSLLARVAREPLVLHVPRTAHTPAGSLLLTDVALREGMAQLGFNARLTAGAPLLIHSVARRGFASLDHVAPGLLAALPATGSVGTHYAFRCNDGMRAGDVRLFEQLCRAWVGERVRDSVAAPLHSDIPTLLLVGEFDPRTPPRNASRLAQQLTHAQVALLPWHGHSRLPDCAFHIIDAFVDAPERTVDTACLDSLPPIRFATDIVHSRWFGRAVVRAGIQPLHIAAPAGAALLLLLVPFVGLPLRAGRRLRQSGTPVRVAASISWLTAVTGLALLGGAAAAAWAGAQQGVLVPAIGVPAQWRWVLLLPWLLLALTLTALVQATILAGRAGGARYLYWSSVAGGAIVLVLWALHSVV